MPRTEIDVDPCDHITSDAIGQPGQRVFYIQALQADRTYTVIIEKTHLQSLAVGVEQFLAEVERQNPGLVARYANSFRTGRWFEFPIRSAKQTLSLILIKSAIIILQVSFPATG